MEWKPKPQFQKEITCADVFKSPMVATPLQLHECCPFTDGATAVILASEEAAKKLTSKPVFITDIGQSSSRKLSSQYKYLPRIRARELASQQAYKMAGLTPQDIQDIDVCELHDCFSIAALIAAEGLGFFDYGTAGPIGATGVSQTCEITRQPRGELAEEGRQVEGAKLGFVDTLGGDGVIVNLIHAARPLFSFCD
jgi:Acetyl-CoA acetyltransferase